MMLLFTLCTHHVQWKCIHELHIRILDSRMEADTSPLLTHDLNHPCFHSTVFPSAHQPYFPPQRNKIIHVMDQSTDRPECETLIRDPFGVCLWCYFLYCGIHVRSMVTNLWLERRRYGDDLWCWDSSSPKVFRWINWQMRWFMFLRYSR